MIGHNYNLKVANPALPNNRVPGLVSNSFQPPFYRPQSQTPMNLGSLAFNPPSSKPPVRR